LTICLPLLYTIYMEHVYAAFNLNDTDVFPVAQKFPTFGVLVTVILKNALMFAGVISFIFLVFGGFSVIMGAGGGDTKQLEKGRKAITGAVTGLVIVLFAYWFVQIIEKLTGLSLLNP
jgi:hypothetical protein